MAGFGRPEAPKVAAAVTSPYHQVAVQVSMRGQSPWGSCAAPAAPSHQAAHTPVRAGHSSLFWNSSQAPSS